MRIFDLNYDFINDKYNFYYDSANRCVICTTVYKGKIIRAVAKCSQEDSFNLETGKKLAYLRCKYKFLRKKSKIAADSYAKAWVAKTKAERVCNNTAGFVDDVKCELTAVKQALMEFENSL